MCRELHVSGTSAVPLINNQAGVGEQLAHLAFGANTDGGTMCGLVAVFSKRPVDGVAGPEVVGGDQNAHGIS